MLVLYILSLWGDEAMTNTFRHSQTEGAFLLSSPRRGLGTGSSPASPHDNPEPNGGCTMPKTLQCDWCLMSWPEKYVVRVMEFSMAKLCMGCFYCFKHGAPRIPGVNDEP